MRNARKICRRALALVLVALLSVSAGLAERYMAGVDAEFMQTYSDAALKKPAGKLPQYAIVSVTGEKGDVVQLMQGNKTLYAKKGALSRISEESVPASAKLNTRVYMTPDKQSKSVALKKGTKVNLLYVSDTWAMIEKGGNVGYAPLAHIVQETSAPAADPFLPTATQEAANNSGVVIETSAAVVSAAKLIVYRSASTKSAKLGTLKKDEKVTIHAYSKNWAYIEKDNKYGFCARNGLTAAVEAPVIGDELSGAVKVTVTAASVKVYAKSDEKSKKLGTLSQGMQVNLLSTIGDWSYIELNGRYGYCAADALNYNANMGGSTKPAGGEVIDGKAPMGIATVIEPTTKMYDNMSSTSKSSTLKLGQSLYFYGYDSKWVLVGYEGVFRFVPRKALSAESYAELQSEDSGAAVQELQEKLLALGYLDAVPGASYSTRTVDAVKRLQAACGMEQSGKADVALLRVLYSGKAPASPMLSVSLTSGSSGESVTRLQTRLFELGYFSRSGSIDGEYGKNTTTAIQLFQTAAEITTTGKADNATVLALYKLDAPKLAAGSEAADAQRPASSSGNSGNTTQISPELGSDTSSYSPDMSIVKKLEHVIYCAQQQLGKKYVYGATGMSSFDCSGLTLYAFKQIGVSLPHSAYSQGYNDSRQKLSSRASLRRGDLVFFNTVSDGDQCDHVGIYLGDNRFIHASSGAGKVVISDLSSGYYNRVFSWGRRVLG